MVTCYRLQLSQTAVSLKANLVFGLCTQQGVDPYLALESHILEAFTESSVCRGLTGD